MSKAEAGYRKKFVTNIFYFTHILKSISVCVIKTCCSCEVCAKTFVAMATMQFSFSKAFNFYRR